jgi:hypothetical protein
MGLVSGGEMKEGRTMRAVTAILCLTLLLTCTGCSVGEMFLDLFGADAYSGGGISRQEKMDHMNGALARP